MQPFYNVYAKMSKNVLVKCEKYYMPGVIISIHVCIDLFPEIKSGGGKSIRLRIYQQSFVD